MIRQCKVLIQGKVQGVSFRAGTRSKASELGLAGYVKNLADGRVEALFRGDERALSAMLQWCKRGPSGAKVESADEAWQAPDASFEKFEILFD